MQIINSGNQFGSKKNVYLFCGIKRKKTLILILCHFTRASAPAHLPLLCERMQQSKILNNFPIHLFSFQVYSSLLTHQSIDRYFKCGNDKTYLKNRAFVKYYFLIEFRSMKQTEGEKTIEYLLKILN